MKKVLVLGIIALFIGVAVAPNINAGITVKKDTIQKTIDSSVIETSDSEDDCGCKPISNLHLAKLERLLNRVEIYTNILSLLFKHNPEITEKCEELSNKIKENSLLFSEQEVNLPLQDFTIICDILFTQFVTLVIMVEMCYDIQDLFEEGSFWYQQLGRIAFFFVKMMAPVVFISMFFSCDWLDEL